jgi:hypothetical protein
MPMTPTYGFEYETPLTKPGITLTGDSDGSAPILAEQVETALAGIDSRLAAAEGDIATLQTASPSDTGWVALSVAAAGGYSVTTSLYRQWGPVVMVVIVLTRTGGSFPANSAGNVTDTTLCTINTVAARPPQQTYTAIQCSVTSGSALMNTNGTVVIADMHSNSVISTDDVVRISNTYFSATFN